MENDVQLLVEMGASYTQARAALRQYKDVMQAAERFFEGKFDHIQDEAEDAPMASTSDSNHKQRPATPEDEDMSSDDEDADYVDYDSDFEKQLDIGKGGADVDPYSGIFFSKDRREEVIEVEEEPEIYIIPETNERVKLMTQGQWMKGCPEGGEQSFLFGLYSQLSESVCMCPHDCGGSVTRSKGDFFSLFSEFSTYIDRLRKVVHKTCTRCHSDLCVACGEPMSAEKGKRPTTAKDDPLFHCSNLQGVILGVGLSMLEQLFTEQTQENYDKKECSTRTTKRRKTEQNSTPDNDEDDGVYYAGIHSSLQGKKAKGGTGYAGDQKEDNSGQLEAQATQKLKDEKIGTLLSAIRVYLPNLHREGGGQTSDYLVHPTALAHLRRRFNYVCSSLLRNDSLADMSERSILYFELLQWLETISNHEALASMMAMPIMVVTSVKAVTAKSSLNKSSLGIRERTIVYEGSSGPRELLEAIAIQAQAALKGLEGNKAANVAPEELTEEQKRMTVGMQGKFEEQTTQVTTDENQKLLDFCRRILATVNAIDRSLQETKGDDFVDRLRSGLPNITPLDSHNDIKTGDTKESTHKAYMDWATRTRFEYCDLSVPSPKEVNDEDQTPHYKFFYDNEARMLSNSDIPKRSLAIAKELAILTTNLPVAWDSSIYLRVDETRVDVIKALITGPEGTPYYNGCFLFDIFLGPNYNQSPPSVKYMTTNGGKFRFNPNLYADGKVCLSLLGTWQGPGWVAGKSTLLQVLISIQSMILCEEPYLNEPGWSTSGGTPQSHAYSANVRRMVVKTAMLGNLKNPPEPFGDVIRTHFRLKARYMLSQLDDWLGKDDGRPTINDGGNYGHSRVEVGSTSIGLQKDTDELKQLLRQL